MTSFFLADDDPRWARMEGGYRVPYNPLPCLKLLAEQPMSGELWEEFWNDLHHQGDVGAASYAALVALVDLQRRGVRFDWNYYAMLAVIEVARGSGENPPLPDWLRAQYELAWRDVLPLACRDVIESDVQQFEFAQILAVVALAKGFRPLGGLLSRMDDSEIDEYLADH